MILLAALLAGCGQTDPPRSEPVRELGAIHRQLVQEHGARAIAFPDAVGDVGRLPGDGTLVVLAHEAAGDLREPLAAALARWCAAGGRMVLLGHAAPLVETLPGTGPGPDRTGTLRWGFDERTRMGQLEVGFELATRRGAPLVEGMRAATRQVFLLAGGEGVELQRAHWVDVPPGGEVLGRYARRRDGVLASTEAVALVRWELGKGEVLAFGHLPRPDLDDGDLAHNARRFLANLVGARPVRVTWTDEPPPEPAPDPGLPPLSRREIPEPAVVGPWGWQVAARAGHARREPWPPARVRDEVLLPSWRSGADLVDLQLADRHEGYPLPWGEDDPVPRPDGYRGGAGGITWSARAVQELVAEAHGRSMLVQLLLQPPPVGPHEPAEALTALRWLTRELADRRILGGEAVDGFTLGSWLRADRGLSRSMVEDLHAGAWLADLRPHLRELPGTLAVADAERGRPAGCNAAGVSARWRPAPSDRLLARLDARLRRPPVRQGGEGVRGGGSSSDWLVTQWNDFLRSRRGEGAAVWWRAFNPAVQDEEVVATVHGLGCAPLVAAIAGRLLATGDGGWRERVADRARPVQEGFGAESPVPARSHVLQNNHLRLHGLGGALLFDPGGLGRFRPGRAVVLAETFVATRFRGGRISGQKGLRGVDFLAAGTRGEGGYGQEVVIDAERRGADPAPERLAFDADPHWPQRVRWSFVAEAGRGDLHLRLRAVEGAGIVAVRREGVLAEYVSFGGGAPEQVAVPFHVGRPGERSLSLEVVDGGEVALEAVFLRPSEQGLLGNEEGVGERAGHRASLRQWTGSPYVNQRTEIVAVADLPGLAVAVERGFTTRNLTTIRRFGLRHHRRVRFAAEREGNRLRGPFVLASDRAGVPDLAVVPVDLARNEYFVVDEEGLSLRSQPYENLELRLGMLLLTDPAWRALDPAELLRHLTPLFRDVLMPVTLDLGGGNEADLRLPTPFPWPRVVRVLNPARTPYLVRENGWWVWRGGQPTAEVPAADWLRVHHVPGTTTSVAAGQAVVRGTRPGPGAARLVALRDPRPDAVTVRVRQPGVLAPPSVVMESAFDQVLLDGRPWSWFDGRRVFLPRERGTYRIETGPSGGRRTPHLVATRARVEACAWNEGTGVLELRFAHARGSAAGREYTAFVAGPEPDALEGAVRVDEETLPHRDDAARARARAAGVVIRFLPGRVRLRYVP